MGQFLHIGLAYQLQTSKKELEKEEISLQEFQEKTNKETLLDFSLYNQEKKEDSYLWTLREDILEKQLFLLLENFYPLYYRKNKNYYEGILPKIKDKTGKEIIEYAQEREEEAYQLSDYFESKYIYFEEKGFNTSLDLSFRLLILTMEGKISKPLLVFNFGLPL